MTALALRWAAPVRLSLLDRYILSLMARPSLACLGVTLTMMLLERALRLITEITAKGAKIGFFFDLMANQIPYYVGLALPASFFISMFMVLAKLDEGAEIDAMLASGRSIGRLVLPLTGVGLALGLFSLAVFGFIQPYGQHGFRAVLAEAQKAGWTGELQSGVFAAPDASTTLMADKVGADGRSLTGVFLSRIRPDGSETVATARTGVSGSGQGAAAGRLSLGEGVQLADRAGSEPEVLRFANIGFEAPAPGSVSLAPRGADVQELTLVELADQLSTGQAADRRKVAAEFYARLARALSIPFLPMLALPLAMAAKRGRRGPGLVVAAIVLIGFHHGVQLVAGVTARSGPPPWLGVGGLLFAFCAFNTWLFLSSLRRPGETPLTDMLNGMGSFGGWVTSRFRRPSRPVATPGRLGLRAYVARLLFFRVGAAAAVIVALLQIIELLERTGMLLDRGVGLGGIAYYSLLEFPVMAQQGLGFAMFIGSVFTFTALAQSGEMIAIRAAGVPLRRVVAMVLPIALVFSAVDLVVADWAAPRAEHALRQWLEETAPPSASATPKPLWLRKEGEVIRIGRASPDGTRLDDLRVYRRDAKGDLVERLTARTATLRNGEWELTGPSRWSVGFDSAQMPALRDSSWRTTLQPREIVEVQGLGSLVSLGAAVRSLQGAASNQSPNFFLTRLNRLLAEPLGLLVMVLLAAPLALSHGRSDRSLGLVLYRIGGGLLYLVSDGLMTVWGQVGLVPPLLAAWGAPLAFAAGALTVLLYAEG